MQQAPDIVMAIGFLPNGSEWIIILIVMLLLFGKRLPEIMRGLGGSVKEFKKGMDDVNSIDSPSNNKPDGSVSRDANNDKH